MKATTDSLNNVHYDPANQPGISNLLTIASILDEKTISELESTFKDKGYGEFKKYVADVVTNKIGEFQNRYDSIINSKELDEILDKGIKRSKELAKEKYELMKERMGVVR